MTEPRKKGSDLDGCVNLAAYVFVACIFVYLVLHAIVFWRSG